MNTEKCYKVNLYFGKAYVGTYKVQAPTPEIAREYAWELAESECWAEETEEE